MGQPVEPLLPTHSAKNAWGFLNAFLLGALSIVVLLNWHFPLLMAGIYPTATLMAYNTALGLAACSLGLWGLIRQIKMLVSAAAVMAFCFGIFTLLDLFTPLPIDTARWFTQFLSVSGEHIRPIPPTACIAFLFASAVLLAGLKPSGLTTLFACVFCIIILFITLTAMLGQGYAVLPRFVWMGINMAPHTAIGFTLFALGAIGLNLSAALIAFNRLNLFSRLATGFLTMSLFFIAVGSIGALQINSVASITQELYESPIKTSNAALRVKHGVGSFNRRIKDLAVNPHLAKEFALLENLAKTEAAIVEDIDLIESKTSAELAAVLNNSIALWLDSIRESHKLLSTGTIDKFRNHVLTNTQERTIDVEYVCDAIVEQAEQRMAELKDRVEQAKAQASNLMLLVVIGFVVAGLFTAALITRSITGQLRKIRGAMEDLASGNTHIQIPYLDHPHELGAMAQTLNVFAENIAARKKNAQLLSDHQEKLEESNHRLAQINKELETFAYVASHDLKSPLRGIAQLSTWIDEDLAEQSYAEVQQHTVMLRKRIQRMERLLDDMLIFYRAGKADGKVARLDTKHVASELFEIQNTKPGLQLALGDNLPIFETYVTPFEQVLRNLLSNAIKHHDQANGLIQFHCNDENDRFYAFTLTDDGPGIPEKFQERVFKMFQTLKSRDELEGSGMGLALIKKLVETYGGTVSVTSEGRGCSFTFTWPRKVKEENNDGVDIHD